MGTVIERTRRFSPARRCSPITFAMTRLRHGRIPPEPYLARVAWTKDGWLAARRHPHADRELLQVIANCLIGFHAEEDANDSGVLRPTG
ncbi:hypothetical protein FJV41_24050 [Myxococcus llanfairpwllgwyngyllgogerychwyrndrobwllllantysiliogogogochensis]|uniref:Uncharacterized protein n=1 Tax=Myxococcus llanfairpwllgwyngyllgogerychwyrndrobwllllantysiliogogogochensis TaxID=2590453 RepID=A0A540WWS4_9BACT|nr:hypothetical protein [Myxococcus llanfairpwllgwyngyllgogerychwyrndrobwllllantysiliogogogochensis]TQF13400.1 hypothetical protein FJV41_24050 [Myxococcus llanfairpwllgwyngyllgogerychwyrndrobwllllantysiliogogogochensis]